MNIREFRDYIKSTKQDDFYTLDYCGLKFRLFKDDKVIISYGGKATRYDLIFFLIILLPGLPDDLFCYISGITKMSLKKFTLIILIGKPLTLLVYSICFQFFPIIFGKFL